MSKLSLTKKYATYPKYKNSGVEWVGQIPSQWKKDSFRGYVYENKNKNLNGENTNLLSLSYGNIIEKDIETNGGLLPESFNTYQIVSKGNIVLRLTDLQNDKKSLRVGYVSQDSGIITSAYLGLQVKDAFIDKYLYYLLHSYDLLKVFYNLGGGVRQALDFKSMKYLPVVVPEKEEQEKIARFLDEQTARIDETIAKKERLIELLKEKRTATINRAVTKGLDPKAELVDSGIDWIGKIPKGWEVKKLKYSLVGSGYKAGPFGSSLITENLARVGKYKVFTPEHVSQNSFNFEYDAYLPDERVSEMSQFIAQEDDVLIPIVGSLGKAAVVPKGSLGIINQRLARLRPNQKILFPPFLKVLLSDSTLLKESSKTDSRGAILEHITKDKILNWFVQLPPVKEQKEIYEFVLKRMNHYDYAINQVTKSKSFLEEFKSSVISHAVTGKIKV